MGYMSRYATFVMRRLAGRLHAPAGFSLVELMTVLGVVGIIMAIAAPTISSHIALQEVRGAGRGVVDVLRDARDSAVNEGVPRYVLFDWSETPREYQMYKFSGGSWVTDGELFRLPGSVTFDQADVTFPSVSDAPEGTGESVPQYAAYFDTRGRYPFDPLAGSSYEITLNGGLGRTVTLTVWRNTGQVTGL
jgi:prepilin-type N-terminal cleavage/methylation domain-containing protein